MFESILQRFFTGVIIALIGFVLIKPMGNIIGAFDKSWGCAFQFAGLIIIIFGLCIAFGFNPLAVLYPH
ncbi:MAG: hypothetical protein ACYDBB_05230 [Armatimonadota bacterium]